MTPALVVTSLWYALADDRDPNHHEAILLPAAPRRPATTTNAFDRHFRQMGFGVNERTLSRTRRRESRNVDTPH